MNMNLRDAEMLSAYLDGQLSPADARRLQGRLTSEPDLKAALDDMRVAPRLVGKLPKRRAPRNFALTRQMRGVRAPEPRAVPGLRFASLVAAALLLTSFAVNGLAPVSPVGLASAPVPANAIEGGASTTEQAPQSFAAAPAMAATPSAQDLAQPTPLARVEAVPKSVPPAAGSLEQAHGTSQRPVPGLLQRLLAGAMVLCAGYAWYLQRRRRRQFLKG